MKKRVITGAVYVIVLIGLLAMKWLIPGGWGALGFDALFCAVSVLGCLEYLKAVKAVSYPQKALSISFCAMCVPLFTLVEMTAGAGLVALAFLIIVFVIAQFVLYFTHYEGSTLKSTLLSLLAMCYCGVLSTFLSAVNHITTYSVAAILMLFLTIMLTDSAAFFTGSIFKRWLPQRLAPKISPNKTIIGAAGGLIGGMAGAVAAFYIYYGLSIPIGTPQIVSGGMPAVVAFLLVGLVASIFGQAGDLFESGLKRKCGIKDSGKLLPGHGGVLDRFDSMLFAGVIVLFSFGVLIV